MWRYAKRPFRGPEPLFRYLGRYTHRIGFSNHRLRSVSSDSIVFTVRARDPDSGQRRVILTGPEFLRRLLLHVLPKGFVRIRHYGLYSSTHRAIRLARARQLLACTSAASSLSEGASVAHSTKSLCPTCNQPLVCLRLAYPPNPGSPLPAFASPRAPPHAA